jgi:hypothetical protein
MLGDKGIPHALEHRSSPPSPPGAQGAGFGRPQARPGDGSDPASGLDSEADRIGLLALAALVLVLFWVRDVIGSFVLRPRLADRNEH